MARSPENTGAGSPPPHPVERGWDVVLLPEVAAWYVRLGARHRAFADRALDRLAASGSGLAMPHGLALGEGLYELRFSCEGVSRRITYAFGPDREVTALTTFRKQRGRERHEVDRARAVLGRTRSAARVRDGRRAAASEGSAVEAIRAAATGRIDVPRSQERGR